MVQSACQKGTVTLWQEEWPFTTEDGNPAQQWPAEGTSDEET